MAVSSHIPGCKVDRSRLGAGYTDQMPSSTLRNSSSNLAWILGQVRVGANLLNISVPRYPHLKMGLVLLTYLL